MKHALFLTAALLGMSLVARAHDFTAVVGGQKVYFNITSTSLRTAEVTYQGDRSSAVRPTVSGTVEIPAKVKHKGVVYDVVAIGPKAFSHADKLTGIVIPQGVRSIGDFAFEHCPSLSRVVFPGNEVTLGQGTFFMCRSVSAVTFGSDWRTIDLMVFRWSEALTAVNIPAKVGDLRHMSAIKPLQTVTVDANNMSYASADGALYTADGSTLIACPRGRKGALHVKSGTTVVAEGALAGCTAVTMLDLPATLSKMSFRETSGMSSLTTVLMRAPQPIVTAYKDGKGYLLLTFGHDGVRVAVPSKAAKAYKSALATEPGEYATDRGSDSLPYAVSAGTMLTARAIEGVRDFDKYAAE